MTTCHARLKLYREIARLGDRVLYFDTDSIVFISRPGEYEPKLGEFLGEFTDELQCKDIGCKEKECTKTHYITEFISAGPKNYSFKTDIGTTTCKVRGFTLNKTNKLLINFDSMKEMVTAPHGHSVTKKISEPCKITLTTNIAVAYITDLRQKYIEKCMINEYCWIIMTLFPMVTKYILTRWYILNI